MVLLDCFLVTHFFPPLFPASWPAPCYRFSRPPNRHKYAVFNLPFLVPPQSPSFFPPRRAPTKPPYPRSFPHRRLASTPPFNFPLIPPAQSPKVLRPANCAFWETLALPLPGKCRCKDLLFFSKRLLCLAAFSSTSTKGILVNLLQVCFSNRDLGFSFP